MLFAVLRDVDLTKRVLEAILHSPNGRRLLSRLARACRTFREPALNVLWRELDSFAPLAGLFPNLMKKAHRPSLGLVKAPEKHDWGTFNKYNTRVRRITYDERSTAIVVSIFPMLAENRTQEYILPSLEELTWRIQTPTGLSYCEMFLNPTLQAFNLEIAVRLPQLNSTIQNLSKRTRLIKFSFISPTALPESFTDLLHNQNLLEKVALTAPGALSPSIGRWLASLEHLTQLQLDLSGRSEIAVEGFFDELVARSGYSTPSSVASSGDEVDFSAIRRSALKLTSDLPPKKVFYQLRRLKLTGEAANIAVFLRNITSPLTHMDFEIEDPPDKADWQDFCALICERFGDSLLSLRIVANSSSRFANLVRLTSRGKRRGPASNRLSSEYLTSLPNLVRLEIDLPESIIFTSADFARLAQSTPARASTSFVREDDTNSSNTNLSAFRSSAPSSPPQSTVLPIPQPSPIAESPAREASSPVSDNNFLEPLKAFNPVVKGLANIHPYAKVALNVLSWASQAIVAHANQDKSIQAFQSRIADVYEFMLEDGRLQKLISMKDILAQASQVVLECAKFIQVYSQPNFLSRLGNGVFSDTDEAVAKYTNAIENLMQQFHQHDALTNTRDISTTTYNIRHALEDIRQLGDNQLLNRISYAEGAGLDTNKACLDGTREGILHEVINWIDDADPNAPRILWLFGTACTGKSAIAHTIARAMKDSGALGSCFCFEKGDVERHTKLFSTISRDLAIGDVWLKQALASVVARDPSVATTADVIQQWDNLIKKPLSVVWGDTIGRLVIVIDALDESGDPRTRKPILSLLTKQAFALPRNVRILVTSRLLPDIHTAFGAALHIKRLSMDEIPISSTERDIQIYISNQLSDADYSFSPDEIVVLAKKSDGLFEWARLVCNHIMSDRGRRAGLSEHERYKKLMLQTESEGIKLLDDMYTVILKEIMGDRPEELVLSRFRSVMRDVLFTLEPLTLDALNTMHQTVQAEQDNYGAEPILQSMGSLIAGIHDRFTPIRPLHYSFHDFLIDPDRSGQFFVDGDDGSNATRRYLESTTKLLIGHADRLTKQPDFHGMDHFAPEFGNLTNRNPEAIEDWEQILDPLLNVLDKLLVPSKIDSLKDRYCQECRFFQITRDTLAHFQTLRQRDDPDVEKYLKYLEEIMRYSDAANFDMNFNRVVFGSAAIVGFMMAILAHQR